MSGLRAVGSGVPPHNGIYWAMVAGFAISALGGSRVQIGGPTGAFVVVVSGIVAVHGLDGLFMCTLLAGVILLLKPRWGEPVRYLLGVTPHEDDMRSPGASSQ